MRRVTVPQLVRRQFGIKPREHEILLEPARYRKGAVIEIDTWQSAGDSRGMARKLRVEYPGVIRDVMKRGGRRDAVASLYPTAEEAGSTCAIVDAAPRRASGTPNIWPKAKARPSPSASAPRASPPAIRIARAKVG